MLQLTTILTDEGGVGDDVGAKVGGLGPHAIKEIAGREDLAGTIDVVGEVIVGDTVSADAVAGYLAEETI